MGGRTEYALRFFRAAESRLPVGLGTVVGGVRRANLNAGDPRLLRLRELDHRSRAEGPGSILSSWSIRRHYSEAELDAADLLHVRVHATFEPCGEQCGTEFDESTSCPSCGSGRRQVGPLVLDLRGHPEGWDAHTRPSPRGKDVSKTIAGEIVISTRFANLLREAGATGYALGAIRQYRRTETRRDWHQLLTTAPPVAIAPPTEVGVSPFDDDDAGEYVCPLGHVVGLNLISELSVERAGWDGSDFIQTREAVGVRRGYLMPEHPIIVSPRIGRLIRDNRIKGARLEVVNLT